MRSVSETVTVALETLERVGYVFKSDARLKVISASSQAKTRGDVAKILSALLPDVTLTSPDYGHKP